MYVNYIDYISFTYNVHSKRIFRLTFICYISLFLKGLNTGYKQALHHTMMKKCFNMNNNRACINDTYICKFEMSIWSFSKYRYISSTFSLKEKQKNK